MAISAGKVKELREKTGLPMMECKKALEESNGDEAQAIELLRKKGLAQATKRAGRATGQGRVCCYIDEAAHKAAIVELLCETEPVAGTDDFVKLSDAAAKIAATMDNPTAESLLTQPDPNHAGQTIGDTLNDVVNRIRENIRFGRVVQMSGDVGSYIHHDGHKAVLVEFTAPCPPELAADVCMHIVAMRPPYTTREEVDPAQVESERAIAAEQVQGKPENIIEKIVNGKIDKWFSEIVLLEQAFVKDDKKSVGQALKEAHPELSVKRFARVEIGDE